MAKNKLKKILEKITERAVAKLLMWWVSTIRYDRNQLPQKPCIFAVWHEDIMVTSRFFSNYNTVAIVSPSQDAERLAVPISDSNNITLLRFSSSKPALAVQGLYEMMKYKEHCLGLTIDGPLGPRRKAKPGVLIISKRLGLPLYACRFSYKGFRLRTWDKLKMPLPFTKMQANLSAPMLLDRQSDIRSSLTQLEGLMEELGDD